MTFRRAPESGALSLGPTFSQRTDPRVFSPEDWDSAWEQGWFRMRQTMFTTSFLEFERRFHSAVWLRVGLPRLEPDHKAQQLKKLNRAFRVEIRPAPATGPSDAQESLYRRYRDSVEFEPAPSLRDLLLGTAEFSSFPTWQIELFDGPTLIAAGFFDRGDRAAAGIVSFYDPMYRKHSLGKDLIYRKMEFCRAEGMDSFYPGYLAPGEPRFDYKRSLGAATLEYLDLGTGVWLPFPQSGPQPDPLADMTQRLEAVQRRLQVLGFRPALRRFLHLDINLNSQLEGLGLFDYPVFLDCFPRPGHPPFVVLVYDPRDDLFHLFQCRSVYRFDFPGDDEEVFESDLLVAERSLFATPDPEELVASLAWFPLPVRG